MNFCLQKSQEGSTRQRLVSRSAPSVSLSLSITPLISVRVQLRGFRIILASSISLSPLSLFTLLWQFLSLTISLSTPHLASLPPSINPPSKPQNSKPQLFAPLTTNTKIPLIFSTNCPLLGLLSTPLYLQLPEMGVPLNLASPPTNLLPRYSRCPNFENSVLDRMNICVCSYFLLFLVQSE